MPAAEQSPRAPARFAQTPAYLKAEFGTSAGFGLLAVGKEKKRRVHHEGHEEHEG